MDSPYDECLSQKNYLSLSLTHSLLNCNTYAFTLSVFLRRPLIRSLAPSFFLNIVVSVVFMIPIKRGQLIFLLPTTFFAFVRIVVDFGMAPCRPTCTTNTLKAFEWTGAFCTCTWRLLKGQQWLRYPIPISEIFFKRCNMIYSTLLILTLVQEGKHRLKTNKNIVVNIKNANYQKFFSFYFAPPSDKNKEDALVHW